MWVRMINIVGCSPLTLVFQPKVPYPLLALLTRLPQNLRGQSSLSVRTRTFDIFTLVFEHDTEAADVFDSVKELTVARASLFLRISAPTRLSLSLASINNLYAFYYSPTPPLQSQDGWSIYSPRDEFGRMGVGTRSRAWRFTDINKDYSVCQPLFFYWCKLLP
jgi:myotubularin-related protein 6/7/8